MSRILFFLVLVSTSAHAARPWQRLQDQFLLTEEWVAKFDRAIESGKTIPELIQTNPDGENLYAKLLALRALHEKLVEEIEQSLLTTSGGLESRVRSETDPIRKSPSVDSRGVDFAIAEVLSFARERDVKNGLQLESMSPVLSVSRFKSWRTDFRASGAKAQRSAGVKALQNWLTTEAANLQAGLEQGLELERGTLNPGLVIYPSTQSAGNITGSAYPEGTWSLTFDDGPAGTTDEVIENLKRYGLQASFFVLTSQLDQSASYRSKALQELADGHDVFSHSYHHLQISKLGSDSRKHEIEDAIQGLSLVTGARPEFFRLPYGAGVSVPAVRADLLKSCVVHVFWNVDTLDWHDHDPDVIFGRTLTQMNRLKKGIILFHDIHSQSVIASEQVMKHLKENQLKTVRVSDWVRDVNQGNRWGCKLGW